MMRTGQAGFGHAGEDGLDQATHGRNASDSRSRCLATCLILESG